MLVSEDGMSNVFSPIELIGLLQVKPMGHAFEEATCYWTILLGITRAPLNTQSFIFEASFQETAWVCVWCNVQNEFGIWLISIIKFF